MKILKILFLLQLFEILLFAQEIKNVEDFFNVNNITMNIKNDSSNVDPYSFFPSQVGNFWQYSGNYIRTETITKDSLKYDGTKLLYYGASLKPRYLIDTCFCVYYYPTTRNKLIYILNAKINDRWWVYTRYDDSVFVEGQIAEVDTIYQGTYLGKQSTFKVFSYYFVYNNSGELEEYWDHDAVLASGMGLVYEDMDAERPKVLIAAIIDGDTLGTIVDVEKIDINLPTKTKLENNYPNPFNPVTTIDYTIPVNGMVTIKVFDTLGREVVTLVNEQKKSGRYSVKFDAAKLPSGIYYYTLITNSKRITKSMVLLK